MRYPIGFVESITQTGGVDASRSVEGSKIGHNYCLLCSKMLEQMAGSTSTKLLYVFRMIVESNVVDQPEWGLVHRYRALRRGFSAHGYTRRYFVILGGVGVGGGGGGVGRDEPKLSSLSVFGP